MTLRLLVLASCVMLTAPSPSGADTLTFDDIPAHVYWGETLEYRGLRFGSPLKVTPYQGTHPSAPHVAIGTIQGASFYDPDNRPFFLNDLWVGYALEPLHGELELVLPNRSVERRLFVLSPYEQKLITINRFVTRVNFPSLHNYPPNNGSTVIKSLLLPDYSGQAGAVTLDNIRINEPAEDIVLDFGPTNGLWLSMNPAGSTPQWSKLHDLSPTHMAVGDVDGNGSPDIIADFAGYGVWIWSNNSRWTQLHPLDVADLVVGDLDGNGRVDVMMSFPGYGLYAWMNNTRWVRLHSLTATGMAIGNLDNDAGHRDELIANFSGAGVWVWKNNSAWAQLHALNAIHIATGDVDGNGMADVVLDFPGRGVWTYMNNATWVQRHSLNSLSTTIGNLDGDAARRSELVASFPGAGVWALFNNTASVQLHSLSATQMITADLDGNGRADLLMNFPGAGIWAWMNNTSWIQLHPFNGEDMAAGPIDNN
jgi:hypothetical protein